MKASEVRYENMTASQLLNFIGECQLGIENATKQYEKLQEANEIMAWEKVKKAMEDYCKTTCKRIYVKNLNNGLLYEIVNIDRKGIIEVKVS